MPTIEVRTQVRAQGNYQDFSPSLTHNVLLPARFPQGTTKPAGRYVLWQGPVLKDPALRILLLDRSLATHFMIPDATNPMGLPSAQRGNFPGGDGAESLGRRIGADTTVAAETRQAVLEFANPPHKVGYNQTAYRYLGYQMYKQSVADNNGVVPTAWGCDLENHIDKDDAPGAKEMVVVNIYEGAKQALSEINIARVLGGAAALNVLFYTYGYASLARVNNHTNNPDDGDPNHMDQAMRLPSDSWRGSDGKLSVTDAKTAIWRDGVAVGQDKYPRHVYDNATLWQKNGDGSLKVVNGRAMYYYGARTITNFGQTYPTYMVEAEYYLNMMFSEPDKILSDWVQKCNTNSKTYDGKFGVNQPFPVGTSDLRAGMEKVLLNTFFRDNAETGRVYNNVINDFEPLYTTPELGEEAANQRALYPQSIEMIVMLRRFLYHVFYLFSNEGNYAGWENGKANQYGFPAANNPAQTYYIKRRFGQFEGMIAALRRASNFPYLFTGMDAGKAQFIIPWRFVYDGNRSVEEAQSEKPVFWGVKVGRLLYLLWCMPGQDVNNAAHERTLEMWAVKSDGSQTPSYGMLCKDRHTGFDQILLPVGCETIPAENFRFKFSGLVGGPYFRTGKYTVPFSGSQVVPVRAASEIVSYTLPSTTNEQ